MPIIKTLQLEPTSDIEDFAESIFEPKRLSIIHGPEGMGKLHWTQINISPFYHQPGTNVHLKLF